MGQNFHRNRSISLHFQGKHVFTFCAEIQVSADNLRAKNFVEIALSRSVSEINTVLHFTLCRYPVC